MVDMEIKRADKDNWNVAHWFSLSLRALRYENIGVGFVKEYKNKIFKDIAPTSISLKMFISRLPAFIRASCAKSTTLAKINKKNDRASVPCIEN